MNLRTLLARALTRLARWMPARLRDRFGDEIEQVLSEHLEEAAARGWSPFLQVVLLELLQFPGLHLRQRFAPGMISIEGGINMSTRMETILSDRHPPTPWRWALIALFPFFFSWIFRFFGLALDLAGISLTSNDNLYMIVFSYAILALIVFVSAVLVVAWTRGFPTWSYTLGFLFFVFSLYLSNASVPGLTLFGYAFGRSLLRGFALIPLAAVVVISLIVTRKNPSRPFLQGINDLSHDFSRASFGLYGLTPFFLRLIFDEVHGEENFLLGVDLFLAACALVYLRAHRTAVGVAALAGSQILVLSISAVYLGIYWNGRQEEWMPAPASGWENTINTLVCTIPILLFTLGPWLVHVYNLRKRSHPKN